MADDLSDLMKEVRELKREVERLKSARMLENASVTNGRLRFIGGQLRVDSGGSVVIVGSLQIDGTTIATGPWTFTGNGTISGNVTITGTLTQNGTWALNGNGTIAGDVNVTGGGRIRAGTIVINPSTNGGTIEFGAHTIYASGNVMSINHSSGAQVVLNTSGVNLIGGGKVLSLQNTGASLSGLPTISRSSANNATVGSLYMDSSSQIYRVVT